MAKKCLLIGFAAILLASLGGLMGCSDGGGSPSDVVRSFYKAANAGDMDKAMEYVNKGNILAPTEMSLTSLVSGIEKIQILEEERDKFEGFEIASVVVEVYYTARGTQEHLGRVGDVYNVNLEKHASGWKIEFINRARPITVSIAPSNGLTTDNDGDSYSNNNEDSAPSQEHEGQVYTSTDYTMNPKSPGEAAAAYWFTWIAYFKDEVEIEALLSLLPESLVDDDVIRELESLKRRAPNPDGSNFRIIEVRILEVYYKEETEVTLKVLLHQEADIEIPSELVYDMGCVKENGVWKVTWMKGGFEPE